MPHLEIIWDRRNRTGVLLASVVLVVAIATVDWWTSLTSPRLPVLFPSCWQQDSCRDGNRSLGLACALLSERFSNLDPADANIGWDSKPRLCGCGLLTSEVLRNQRLYQESQERTRILVETSPAPFLRQ